MTPYRSQQSYDHRLRDLVRRTGDLTIALDMGIPRSTARGWLSKPRRPVVSLDVLDMKDGDLQSEVLRLENVNGHVDELISKGMLRRVLAFTELKFSNSMIEAWWRSLKHQWLFLNTLDTVVTVRRLVEFYVTEHNRVLPHSAFHGQTPDEMYFGTGATIPIELEERRAAARQTRLEMNRAATCDWCPANEVAA